MRVTTPRGAFELDFLIAGTGFAIDPRVHPDLASVAPLMALWRDRYQPPPEERLAVLETHPYLGPAFEISEKVPGSASWLANVHLFSFGTWMSMGPSGGTLSGLKFALRRLARGITEGIYREDVAQHWASLQRYDEPELVHARLGEIEGAASAHRRNGE